MGVFSSRAGISSRRAAAGERTQRGAAAVELALVFPVLMLTIFGIIQFGFVMAQSAALANGGRTGARFGVVNALTMPNCAAVVARIRESVTTLDMTGANVAVTVRRGTSTGSATAVCSSAANSSVVTGSAVSLCSTVPAVENNALYVTTTYSSPAIVPIGIGNFSLDGTGTFRCEYR